jgi:hypothetical protein
MEESIGFENMSFRERRTNCANSVATLRTPWNFLAYRLRCPAKARFFGGRG